MSLEELEADEQIEINFLGFVESCLFKNVHVSNKQILVSFFEALEQGSRLYDEQASLDTSKNQVLPLSAGNAAMPSINTREKFAATCLNLLFSVSSSAIGTI